MAIYKNSPPDTHNFIQATGITDRTQITAVSTLVADLKYAGIWNKMKAIYPIVGGTAAAHKFNLKDPRDLDIAYRLTFTAGWVHSSTGMLPNGSSDYANTFLNSNSVLSLNDAHVSFYSRTNSDSGCDIGLFDSMANSATQIFPKSSNTRYVRMFSSFTSVSTTENTAAFYLNSRLSSTQMVGYRNGSVLQTVNQNSISKINANFSIGVRTVVGGTFDNYSNRQCAFASIGDGLTDTEAANFYTAVQKFQTTLGRQV